MSLIIDINRTMKKFNLFYAFLPFSAAFQSSSQRRQLVPTTVASPSVEQGLNRRLFFVQSTIASISAFSFPFASKAVDISLLDRQAKRFKGVPAFAIVNGNDGVPFMILRNSGIASAYFFTTYEGASMVLEDARRDAKAKDLESENYWNDAKITSVSMEFALKLSKGNPFATAQNGVKYQSVYDIIPSITAIDTAERIDSKKIWKEQGRVPLFYTDDFELPPEVVGGKNRIPVFFEKADLLAAYNKKFPASPIPQIKVIELVDMFSSLVGEGSLMKVAPKLAENFVVIPNKDQKLKAVEIEKNREKSVSAYQLGVMSAVGGKE